MTRLLRAFASPYRGQLALVIALLVVTTVPAASSSSWLPCSTILAGAG